ncbi:MAG: cyclic nucleotide-binding domain-containing protein [Mariprofundaceae bacterium]|nr:cyclic nucleotide-binding domain-containing protein [Mariprofundaceae bacterium]
MPLNQEKLLHVYRDMHSIFPEDLHIARPLIQMLQSSGETEHARDLAMAMARRMLARGRAGDAIGFLEICRLLDHPDQDEIEALRSMAQVTADGPIDMETGAGKVFMLIDQLSDHETRDFLEHGRLLEIEKGRDIVRQGEVNRNFYLILEGRMDVHMDTTTGLHVNLSKLEPGHFFGEFACVYQLPRSATVTAAEDALVLEFSDLAISQLMQRSPIAGERLMQIVQARLIHSMSYSHPAMTELPEADRKWLADESRVLEFMDGTLITRDGEMADRCCVIVYGKAVAEHKENGEIIRHSMQTGDMFGDVSSHLRLPPNSAIRADGRCLICSMPRKVFQSFMNAYGHFELWVELHGKQRHQILHKH